MNHRIISINSKHQLQMSTDLRITSWNDKNESESQKGHETAEEPGRRESREVIESGSYCDLSKPVFLMQQKPFLLAEKRNMLAVCAVMGCKAVRNGVWNDLPGLNPEFTVCSVVISGLMSSTVSNGAKALRWFSPSIQRSPSSMSRRAHRLKAEATLGHEISAAIYFFLFYLFGGGGGGVIAF